MKGYLVPTSESTHTTTVGPGDLLLGDMLTLVAATLNTSQATVPFSVLRTAKGIDQLELLLGTPQLTTKSLPLKHDGSDRILINYLDENESHHRGIFIDCKEQTILFWDPYYKPYQTENAQVIIKLQELYPTYRAVELTTHPQKNGYHCGDWFIVFARFCAFIKVKASDLQQQFASYIGTQKAVVETPNQTTGFPPMRAAIIEQARHHGCYVDFNQASGLDIDSARKFMGPPKTLKPRPAPTMASTKSTSGLNPQKPGATADHTRHQHQLSDSIAMDVPTFTAFARNQYPEYQQPPTSCIKVPYPSRLEDYNDQTPVFSIIRKLSDKALLDHEYLYNYGHQVKNFIQTHIGLIRQGIHLAAQHYPKESGDERFRKVFPFNYAIGRAFGLNNSDAYYFAKDYKHCQTDQRLYKLGVQQVGIENFDDFCLGYAFVMQRFRQLQNLTDIGAHCIATQFVQRLAEGYTIEHARAYCDHCCDTFYINTKEQKKEAHDHAFTANLIEPFTRSFAELARLKPELIKEKESLEAKIITLRDRIQVATIRNENINHLIKSQSQPSNFRSAYYSRLGIKNKQLSTDDMQVLRLISKLKNNAKAMTELVAELTGGPDQQDVLTRLAELKTQRQALEQELYPEAYDLEIINEELGTAENAHKKLTHRLDTFGRDLFALCQQHTLPSEIGAKFPVTLNLLPTDDFLTCITDCRLGHLLPADADALFSVLDNSTINRIFTVENINENEEVARLAVLAFCHQADGFEFSRPEIQSAVGEVYFNELAVFNPSTRLVLLENKLTSNQKQQLWNDPQHVELIFSVLEKAKQSLPNTFADQFILNPQLKDFVGKYAKHFLALKQPATQSEDYYRLWWDTCLNTKGIDHTWVNQYLKQNDQLCQWALKNNIVKGDSTVGQFFGIRRKSEPAATTLYHGAGALFSTAPSVTENPELPQLPEITC